MPGDATDATGDRLDRDHQWVRYEDGPADAESKLGAWLYVPMPDGSSSEAPVTNPGPSLCKKPSSSWFSIGFLGMRFELTIFSPAADLRGRPLCAVLNIEIRVHTRESAVVSNRECCIMPKGGQMRLCIDCPL